jgi:2-amino-4-hydroxy-6-hydroxymethyldihydropteridine diphosphokinase
VAESELIYLSLGSNLGNRAANLRRAIEELVSVGVHVTRHSSFYETEPVDFLAQPWFLNCVVEGRTSLAPRALLAGLQEIERRLHSSKPFPRGPRIIDLDILFYGAHIIEEPGMRIPHPRLSLRRFVLAPLAEIAPRFRDPESGASVAELLAKTSDRSQVKLWQEAGTNFGAGQNWQG